MHFHSGCQPGTATAGAPGPQVSLGSANAVITASYVRIVEEQSSYRGTPDQITCASDARAPFIWVHLALGEHLIVVSSAKLTVFGTQCSCRLIS